jgi:sugar transferase (PEP-CTERM/EpsH1 system associated)
MPYPPNKGDKIRSYHLLAHLAARYKVHLGTFVDDQDDWQHAETVKQLCCTTHIAALNPLSAKLRSLKALATGRALTLDYYRDAGMRAWVQKTLELYPITQVVVFSSAMAQYAEGIGSARRIVDFVDVDSDKWSQYAEKKPWPLSWLYRREGRVLLDYERQIAQDFDASLFVSQAEAALFRQRAPESAQRIGHFSNGVDTDFFSPEREYDNPYDDDEAAIVFTGAMDYWPNVDAVQWFAQEVFPAVRARNERPCSTLSVPARQNRSGRLPGCRV